MLRNLLCLMRFHEWGLKRVTVFLDEGDMNVCKYCGRFKNPIIWKRR